MSTTLDLRAFALLRELLELDAAPREKRLAEATAGDPELRSCVQELLERDAEAEASGSLDDALGEEALAQRRTQLETLYGLDANLEPDAIPGYRLGAVLGAGGMGLVFAATELESGEEVAIKFIRPGSQRSEAIARFEREVELLERLHHPGITRILTHGSLPPAIGAGEPRPYLVLERVRGTPLDEASQALSLEQRTELIASVCDAVHAAHAAGVVHRDLKPSNVLVDTDGAPHVLDFGIARAIESEEDSRNLTQASDLTHPGQLLGTLAYMSPEQASGKQQLVDERTDVYALGVLLYRVLSGHMPLDLERCALPEAARRVLEVDPLPLGRRDPRLTGDLEVIAACALEKRPGDRYASAASMAEDLRRHLANLSILAKPPGALERLRKFSRRNRAATLVGLGSMVLLFALSIVAILVALRASSDRADALRLARETEHLLRVQGLRTASAGLGTGNLRIYRDSIQHIREDPGDQLWELRTLEALQAARGTPLGEPTAGTWGCDFAAGRVFVGSKDAKLRVWDAQTAALLFELELPAAPFELRATPDGKRVLFSGIQSREEREGVFLVDLEASIEDPSRVRLLAESGSYWESSPVAISRDGSLFAAGLVEGSVRVWDAETLEVRHEWSGLESPIDSIVLADLASGSVVVAGFREPKAQSLAAWSLASGEQLLRVQDPLTRVRRLSLSADQRLVAAPHASGELRVWNLESRELVAEAEFEGPRFYAATLDDQRGWVWGLQDSKPQALDLATGELVPEKHLPPLERPILSMAISPLDGLLAFGHTEGEVSLWQRTAGAWRLLDAFSAHSGGVHVRFGQDGTLLTSSGGDAPRLLTHEARQGSTRESAGYVYSVAFAPEGTRLLSGEWRAGLSLWDEDAHSAVVRSGVHTKVIDHIAWAGPDRAVTASYDGSLAVWRGLQSRDPTLERRYLGHSTVDPSPGRSYEEVRALDVVGSTVYSGDRVGKLHLWELDSGQNLGVWQAHESTLESLEVHPDGKRFASVGSELKLWSAPGELAWEHPLELGGCSVSFSPDGRLLAVGGRTPLIKIFEVSSGRVLQTLVGHGSQVYAVRFHPDGTRLASGGEDGRVLIWDVETWSCTLELDAHRDYVYGLSWSADGSCLASASGDKSVRLWPEPYFTPASSR